MNTQEFLQGLTQQVKEIREAAQHFKSLPIATLQKSPAPGKWSALQCVEHLNRHGEYYIRAIHHAVRRQQIPNPPQKVLHGWLGNKFTEMLSPTAIKPIKTQQKLNPEAQQPDISVLDTFISLQENLLASLQLAATADINRRKISVEFFKPLKIRISDTFNLVVAHELRHIQQAFRATGKTPAPAIATQLMV